MSVEDAARCAMAPAEDCGSDCAEHQPEHALRNGHQAAATKHMHSHSAIAHHVEGVTHWIREAFGPTRGGSAAA